MGYTHYWELNNGIEKSSWDKFFEGATKIIQTAKDAGIGIEDDSKPELICINGIGKNSHETFHISSEDVGFNFCKTAFKPYDPVVTAILIHAKDCFGADIKVTSDGNWIDWEGGTLLYEEVFGNEPQQILGV
jgi:hypothetical protein